MDEFKVDGLGDFARALRSLSDNYPKAMKDVTYRLGRELVTEAKAKAKADSRLANKAAKSLRASRRADAVIVSGGGGRAPYFKGAEFGSYRYKQFKSWRGNQFGGWAGGPGYFLHPAIRESGRDIFKHYMDTLDALSERAFPD